MWPLSIASLIDITKPAQEMLCTELSHGREIHRLQWGPFLRLHGSTMEAEHATTQSLWRE